MILWIISYSALAVLGCIILFKSNIVNTPYLFCLFFEFLPIAYLMSVHFWNFRVRPHSEIKETTYRAT